MIPTPYAILLLTVTSVTTVGYIAWIEWERRKDSADRTIAARVIIGSWETIRAVVEQPLKSLGRAAVSGAHWASERTGLSWLVARLGVSTRT